MSSGSSGGRRTALLKEKVQLEHEIIDLKRKIDDAKRRAARTKVYAPDDWWRETNEALHAKRLRTLEISVELSELKQERLANLEVWRAVALAAEAFLYDEGTDDDEAGDALAEALARLDQEFPHWKTQS